MIIRKKLNNINWDAIEHLHKSIIKYAKKHTNTILFQTSNLDPALVARCRNQASALANEEGFWASECKLHLKKEIKFSFNNAYTMYYIISLGATVGISKCDSYLDEVFKCHRLVKEHIDDRTYLEDLSGLATTNEEVVEPK